MVQVQKSPSSCFVFCIYFYLFFIFFFTIHSNRFKCIHFLNENAQKKLTKDLWNLLVKCLILDITDIWEKKKKKNQTCLDGFSFLTHHIEWGDLRNVNCIYRKGQLKFMHVLWVIVYRPQLIHQEVHVSLSFIMRGSNKSMHIYRTYVAGAGLRSINELREWGFITVEMSSTLLCKCWRNTNAGPVHHREGHLKKLTRAATSCTANAAVRLTYPF